ncbi:MAG: SEC-C domain-containing protein [Candidatus Aegiribacteria sp.]|nr:SEC-C domain-containing protein [Candidatus Aegiribacteria sp.]
MLSPEVPFQSPCPCGSGRKYKNCCWKREKREYATGCSAISDVIIKVYSFVVENMEDELCGVTDRILYKLYEDYDSDLIDKVGDEMNTYIIMNINDICACDIRLDDGSSVIDVYLDELDKELNPMALEFLLNWKEASFSLFEVIKVNYGKSMDIKDMFTGKTFTVTETRLSETAEPLDVFVGRIVPVGNEYFLPPSFLPIFPLDTDSIVLNLRETKKYLWGSRTLTWKRFFKKHWGLLHQIWLERLLLKRTGPKLVNMDGDSIMAFRLTFSLKEGSSFKANMILNSIPDINKTSDTTFDLVVDTRDRKDTTLDNILISTFELSEEKLVAEVNSENRAESIIALIEDKLGDLVNNTEQEPISFDPDAMYKKTEQDEIPLEIKEEIMMNFLDDHYTKWMDMPIPALGGMTPRLAAKKPGSCKKLIQLMKEMDSRPSFGGIDYDTSWLWEELGLNRP